MTITSEPHYLQYQHSVTVQDLLMGNSEFPWIYTKTPNNASCKNMPPCAH